VDLAHLNTHGEPARLLSEFEPEWILHAHLSDNTPWKVHMPLGEGRLDIAGALDALAQVYRGVVSLEGSVPGRGESVLAGNMAALRKLGYTP
jgi:sugar phosphate isomerase/epimerase